MTTREERDRAIREAGYNTFLLRSDDVYIDLLTDSGTNAMSDRQWSAMMQGDEAYAGARSFYRLERAVQDVYGFPYVVPTHQGRGAEHLISKILIKSGQLVPGNMYFTTTRLHQELAGGEFTDVVIDEAHDPTADHPFKGNVDVAKLQRVIDDVGPAQIAYVNVALTVNMAGGQPVSIANLREVAALCRRHGITLWCDATRLTENAFFVKERESGYSDRSIAEIVREQMSFFDGCTMSGKKDCSTSAASSPCGTSRSCSRSASRSSSTRACRPTAVSRAATWRRWPRASARWSTTTTSRTGSVRCGTSATSCSPPAYPS
jgi:tyrosine phenol-lyase